MDLGTLVAQLSPEALAFVQMLVDQGDEETLNLLVQIASEQGIDALESAIQDFIAQTPGMYAPGEAASGLPPDMGMDPALGGEAPSPLPPEGEAMPPDMMGGAGPLPPEMGGMPPEMAGMPPPGMGAPPPPGGGDPLAQVGPSAQPPPEQPKKKKKKVPKYNPPPVRKVERPTLDQILDDAREGREFWRERDERIRKDYDLYHLTYDSAIFGDRDATILGGVVIHKRTQPNTLVNLITSLATAKNDKVQTEMEPRSDGDEYQDAAQDSEDFVLYSRECDEDRWLETQVGEMPLPRKEAGLAALEGGFGWTWHIAAEDEEHPIQYELVPLSQLYDVGHACTRQYTLPLGKARRLHENVRKAYPLEDKTWSATEMVRIIVHMDNDGVYKSIVWEDAAGTSRSRVKGIAGPSLDGTLLDQDGESLQWIQKPERVNFGFRGYNYLVWGGTPAETMHDSNSVNNLVKFKGYGVLTMLRKTFRLMDLFISAVATGALRSVDPPWVLYSDNSNKGSAKRPDTRPNAFNRYDREDKLEPMALSVSQQPDSMNLMNSLIAELQEIQSPALQGAGGVSGIAQQLSTDQAAQQTVAPIIDAMEKWYSLMHKQRLILALRYSIDGKYNKDDDDNELTLFEKFPKRSYKPATFGSYGELNPKDIQKSGVRVKVRYINRNTQEEMAIAQMVTQLQGAHLMSQETALRRMGVKDPKAEIQRIFTDGAFMEPQVLKAVVETAVYESGNAQLIAAWERAFYADMVKGSQGSQPAQPGVPSMPAMPGGPQPSGASAQMAPGAQQAGMMV